MFLLVVAAFGRDKTSSQRDINDFQIKKQAEEKVPEEIAEYLSDENGSEEHAEYLLGDWATADLEDFEFEYQDGGIILEKYNGDNASVIIPSFYEVENTVLPVLKLDKTFSWNRNIINIIISEGVTNITSNTFYQCDSLKHLYIPASIDNLEKSISFIKNGEVLYYGGTEEKWMELNTVSWSEIHFKRVIYNAVADDCINNKDMVVADDQKMIASDCAPLSDFRYDLVEGGICLKDYIGKKSFIKISDNYYINGREYPVKVLDTTFALTNIYAVSVPEGVTTIEIATFNSCGIKKLYLPSSLSKVTGTFWHYFHDLNTLYYGGSEEQFERLLGDVDRWDLDIKHIKYNAIPDDVFKK